MFRPPGLTLGSGSLTCSAFELSCIGLHAFVQGNPVKNCSSYVSRLIFRRMTEEVRLLVAHGSRAAVEIMEFFDELHGAVPHSNFKKLSHAA